MGFKILVMDENGQGKAVHEINDRRVTRVGFNTNEGEAGGILITPHQTEVLLTFEYAHNDGRPTLQDLEAMEHPQRTGKEADAAIARLAKLPSATNTGTDTLTLASTKEEVPESTTSSGSPNFALTKSEGGGKDS